MTAKAMAGVATTVLALALASPLVAAEKKYGPGVSDSVITIGQTITYL